MGYYLLHYNDYTIMVLQFKLKLDNKQRPYWSGLVVHEGNVKLEIVSETFKMNDLRAYRDAYERCTVRMMKELAKISDQHTIQQMLIQDEK